MSRSVEMKVSPKKRKKAILAHLKRCTQKIIPESIKFLLRDDSDISNIYAVIGEICNDCNASKINSMEDNEFAGGQYILIITIGKNYPYEPPLAKFLTNNGVFPINTSDFCIDIGKYHKNRYPAALGFDGFTAMILAGLIGWKHLGWGINLVGNDIRNNKKQIALIKKLAQDSKKINAEKFPEVINDFQEAYPCPHCSSNNSDSKNKDDSKNSNNTRNNKEQQKTLESKIKKMTI